MMNRFIAVGGARQIVGGRCYSTSTSTGTTTTFNSCKKFITKSTKNVVSRCSFFTSAAATTTSTTTAETTRRIGSVVSLYDTFSSSSTTNYASLSSSSRGFSTGSRCCLQSSRHHPSPSFLVGKTTSLITPSLPLLVSLSNNKTTPKTTKFFQQQQRRGMASKKHKRIVKLAKGYRGRANRCYRIAIRRVEKAYQYQYRDRKNRKRDFRRLWIQRINAGINQHGYRYNQFIHQLNKSPIMLDRKVLANLAYNEPFSFKSVLDVLEEISSQEEEKKLNDDEENDFDDDIAA